MPLIIVIVLLTGSICFGHYYAHHQELTTIDATYYFIVLLIGSTCFGHYYAHHQELTTIMLITTLLVSFCKNGGVRVNIKV